MSTNNDDIVEIPIEQIRILNPRSRNKRVFVAIVSNIDHVGLKRPITVTPAADGKYDLVCGQGRLEAYQVLGASTIPAILVNASQEDRYLMSLVENIARRRHKTSELLKEITILSRRGYTAEQISAKVDLERTYVHGITRLLARGEERLIDAVERGILPLTVAVEITTATDPEVQDALREAYETGGLRGQKLVEVKRILAQRAKNGKTLSSQRVTPKRLNAQVILRMYKQTTAEQRAFRARATRTQEHLLVITSALKQLLSDDHFVDLLKTEGLDTLPQRLAARIHQAKKAS
jgi:ParB family transcriptional regulator, chromosome partitioning protein